jgi:hypothetical protein
LQGALFAEESLSSFDFKPKRDSSGLKPALGITQARGFGPGNQRLAPTISSLRERVTMTRKKSAIQNYAHCGILRLR